LNSIKKIEFYFHIYHKRKKKIMEVKEFFQKLNEKIKTFGCFVILSITSNSGSVPRRVGAKMALFPDGTTLGTIGGGALEDSALKDAKKALQEKKSLSLSYQLSEEGIGATCGGKAEVFIDYNNTFCGDLLIFGGGHIGLPLSQFASNLGFRIRIADSRLEYASKERFPKANECILLDLDNLDLSSIITSETFVVLITHSHEVDYVIVKEVLKTSACYIGMIGSSRKVKTTLSRLEKDGFTHEDLNRIYAPIGLDIGAETPAEIAVAIIAEIIAVREKIEHPGYCSKTGK
jgi:xanthine dehydrogenase accessory factor